MNFDIKYTKNLKTYNFIKIKQGLGMFLGIQDWGSITELSNHSGYKLEMLNILTDKVGPTYQRQREKRKEHRFIQRVLSFNLTCGSHVQFVWSTCAAPTRNKEKRGAGFKTQPI